MEDGSISISIDTIFADFGFPYKSMYYIKEGEVTHCGMNGQCDVDQIEKEFAMLITYLRSQKIKKICSIVEEERDKIFKSIRLLQSRGATIAGMQLGEDYVIVKTKK